MNRLSISSALCVLLFSSTLWWQGTDGLQAFTSETARRLKVLESPRVLTDLTFENQDYESVNFSEYEGKIVLVDFIYTNCPDLCHALGFIFKSIKTELEELGLEDQVQIVNISFDVEQDTPDKLNSYVKRYTKDTRNWNALRLKDPEKLSQLLNDFDIVVIPNERGGFDHNAAIHLLDQNGRLIGIYDHQAQAQIIARIRKQTKTTFL